MKSITSLSSRTSPFRNFLANVILPTSILQESHFVHTQVISFKTFRTQKIKTKSINKSEVGFGYN